MRLSRICWIRLSFSPVIFSSPLQVLENPRQPLIYAFESQLPVVHVLPPFPGTLIRWIVFLLRSLLPPFYDLITSYEVP